VISSTTLGKLQIANRMMFMASLEGKSWSWYEGLPPASIHSLRVFHSTFFEEYKESHPSLLLVKDCCHHFGNFIQELENAYGDEEFMDDELLDSLNENPFHYHEKIMDSTLDDSEIEKNPNNESYLTPSEIYDNLQQSSHSFNKQDIYEDDVFIDDEIIETLHANPFQHLDIQESVQQTDVSPLAKNEEINNPIVEFHIHSPELDENFPQACQMSCNSEED
jgi:hypothetical protein